jgi:hypothetical protein
MSSWSSQSSTWDTGSAQAQSYLVISTITVENNIFTAVCQADIRWRDAVIIQARGPLLADIGGQFGADTFPTYVLSWIDGFKATRCFTAYANAQAWIEEMEYRLQTAMGALRALYAVYPNNFQDRTRTV